VVRVDLIAKKEIIDDFGADIFVPLSMVMADWAKHVLEVGEGNAVTYDVSDYQLLIDHGSISTVDLCKELAHGVDKMEGEAKKFGGPTNIIRVAVSRGPCVAKATSQGHVVFGKPVDDAKAMLNMALGTTEQFIVSEAVANDISGAFSTKKNDAGSFYVHWSGDVLS